MASLQSENTEVTDTEWTDYKQKFNKSYPNPEDDKRRREVYSATKLRIAEHNKKYAAGEVTFSMGINQFSDMESHERKEFRGVRLPNKESS